PGHPGASRLKEKLRSEALIGTPGPLPGATLLNPDALNRPIEVEPASPSRPFERPTQTFTQSREAGRAEETSDYRHYPSMLPDFDQIPWVTLAIIALNGIIFWLMERAGGSTDREVMIAYGAQFRPLVLAGQFWRLVTAMFIHSGWSHIFYN